MTLYLLGILGLPRVIRAPRSRPASRTLRGFGGNVLRAHVSFAETRSNLAPAQELCFTRRLNRCGLNGAGTVWCHWHFIAFNF
jgi:hypothetical protein